MTQIKKQKILEKEPDASALLYSESAGLVKAAQQRIPLKIRKS
ncbi:MAG: hypothetical protein Q8S05_10105 [Sulfuricella sp.]|nr:hypothetical protein [Sulfuricella sp.]